MMRFCVNSPDLFRDGNKRHEKRRIDRCIRFSGFKETAPYHEKGRIHLPTGQKNQHEAALQPPQSHWQADRVRSL